MIHFDTRLFCRIGWIKELVINFVLSSSPLVQTKSCSIATRSYRHLTTGPNIYEIDWQFLAQVLVLGHEIATPSDTNWTQ